MNRKTRTKAPTPVQQFRAAMQPVGAVKRIVPTRAMIKRQYQKQARRFKCERPKCEVCADRSTVDVHHMAGRNGGNLLDERTWLAVCRRCHDGIHHDPKTAREQGYLL